MTARSIFDHLDNSPIPSPNSWAGRRPPFITNQGAVLGAPESQGKQNTTRRQSDEARARADIEPGRHNSSAMARARATIEAQAPRTARAIIKERARAYAREPRHLDAIAEGLSAARPRTLVIILHKLSAVNYPRRWGGFGGEVPAVNIRGAMLYARWSRRVANRIARRSV